jgi:hypothetical protein
MKKLLILILLNTGPIGINAQDFDLKIKHSNSTLSEFKRSIGIDIGTSKRVKSGNKIGVLLTSSFNPYNYDYIKRSLADPSSYLIKEVKPKSLSFGLDLYYTFDIYSNEHTALYIGPQTGIINYLINESIHRLPSGDYSERTYTENYFEGPKINIGILIEHEIKNVLLKNMNLNYSISSRIGNYEELFAMGSNDPWAYLAIDFKVGLNYTFIKKEK